MSELCHQVQQQVTVLSATSSLSIKCDIICLFSVFILEDICSVFRNLILYKFDICILSLNMITTGRSLFIRLNIANVLFCSIF